MSTDTVVYPGTLAVSVVTQHALERRLSCVSDYRDIEIQGNLNNFIIQNLYAQNSIFVNHAVRI